MSPCNAFWQIDEAHATLTQPTLPSPAHLVICYACNFETSPKTIHAGAKLDCVRIGAEVLSKQGSEEPAASRGEQNPRPGPVLALHVLALRPYSTEAVLQALLVQQESWHRAKPPKSQESHSGIHQGYLSLNHSRNIPQTPYLEVTLQEADQYWRLEARETLRGQDQSCR